MITYDDSEYIRNLFSFANIKEWNLTYGMRNVGENGNQKGKELFIANFKLPEKEKTLFDEMEAILPEIKVVRSVGNF